jgi:hypothetical protein
VKFGQTNGDRGDDQARKQASGRRRRTTVEKERERERGTSEAFVYTCGLLQGDYAALDPRRL